ncbi:hypothetical protein [Flavobacterium branchiophilum]|uniref:Uncharacterized protein n=1 Tax=Flavobacterium branchiophilum TaxID=55197 RepID=A0A2H3KBY3_9FLAO|nr:hypothetical protein [Flavobacterium branchiophilum]PDS24668.1 hypothetical protein B0A77_07315 [Flavobacterium branchiophilum]
MKPCQYTKDGYCLRPENDYCPADECRTPLPLEGVRGRICNHKDKSIVVLEIIATCEKTALQCDYCGTILTEPKTEC